MAIRRAATSIGRPIRPTVKNTAVPASIGGVNALDPMVSMPPQDCIYCHNLMPSEYGMRLRKGYRQWSINLPSDVRTILPYDNQSGNNAKDRLFSICAEGIYDTTLFNTQTPTQVVNFANAVDDAGYGVYTSFTTDAAEQLILYADAKNGLHQYDGQAETWTVPAITGADPTKVAFVTQHKQRIWVVEQDAADGWYLPVDAIAGEALKFNFGSQFKHGGKLMGLWSWTVDGGDGVDDFLVAVSRAGDVLVYYGSDPSQSDWSLRGSYFIGELPQSRRIAVSYGAELYLLSTFGVISVRDLLNGVAASDPKVGPSAKIARFLRADVTANKDEYGWQLTVFPADGFLHIVAPIILGKTPRQYAMNLNTSAWGFWRDVRILGADTWRGEYYMGSEAGVTLQYYGTLDGVELNDVEKGEPIDFEVLTTFQPYGQHAEWIRCELIRAVGVVGGGTSINIDAVFDYNVNPDIIAPPVSGALNPSLWDEALWDVDVWDFPPTAASAVQGVFGMGRTMAVGMRGNSQSRITLIAWDVIYNTGGLF